MHARNRVFASVCAFDNFYAILSVKKAALGAKRMGGKTPVLTALHGHSEVICGT